MGLFDKFPWTDEHQLNLDWILTIIKKLQGGTQDQVLSKKSNRPLDFGWKTIQGGGGGGGTTDYDELGNKPQINNVTLEGNKSLLDLGIINRFPGLNLPKMNSSSPSAGGSTRYSPEDHVHPSDTSRTTSMQVGSMITSALAWYDPASKSFSPPYDAGTIGKAIEDALSGGVTPEAIQDAVDAYLDDHPALTGMFTNAAKDALITLLENVAYIDGNGQQYLNALITNLAATVSSISAVFTQGAAVISNEDSLDSLEQYLVVTAHYSDGSSAIVTGYTLSGTLTVGTSTITVSYENQTTTFDVTVTSVVYLFKDGDEYTDLTGGWNTTGFNTGGGSPSASNDGTALKIIYAASYSNPVARSLSTVNSIDMSAYSQLVVECEVYNGAGNGYFWAYFPATIANATNQTDAYGADYDSNRAIIAEMGSPYPTPAVSRKTTVELADLGRTTAYVSFNLNLWSHYSAGAYAKVTKVYLI